MSNPRFDLVDIIQTLRRHSKLLLIAVIASAMLGGLFYVFGKKKYEAEADFIISNPLYADRNNLFRNRDTRFVDYFGGDDDLDRVLVIAASDTLRNAVAEQLNLWDAYKLDRTKAEDRQKMKEIFKDKYKMERTEYTTGKVYFEDTDPVRAAAVANLSIEVSENIFRSYYLKMKNNVANSVRERIDEIDRRIAEITAEQVELSRNMSKGIGTEEYIKHQTKATETTVLKEQLIQDKANNISILNELLTGVDSNDKNRYVQVITPATPPEKPAGIGLALTVIGAAFFGFFFVAIYLLIITYYRLLINVQR
ncbi:MAG TPA: Wzz/FepE/Etk N-terminal domain-containing protein [Flavipsychrobacter sp.]